MPCASRFRSGVRHHQIGDELLERRRFVSQAEAKMACFSFIEGWYNPVRLHSALGYRSPMAYEAMMETAIAET
jgi:transposase InsO family protein